MGQIEKPHPLPVRGRHRSKILALGVLAENYRAEDGVLSLRDVEPGAVLELTTTKTKTGNPRLLAAVKISD